jgi:hypothetical protein
MPNSAASKSQFPRQPFEMKGGGGGAGEEVDEMYESKQSYSFEGGGGGGKNSRGGHCFSEKTLKPFCWLGKQDDVTFKEIFQMTFLSTFCPALQIGGCEIFSREGSNFFCLLGIKNGLASKKLKLGQ